MNFNPSYFKCTEKNRGEPVEYNTETQSILILAWPWLAPPGLITTQEGWGHQGSIISTYLSFMSSLAYQDRELSSQNNKIPN